MKLIKYLSIAILCAFCFSLSAQEPVEAKKKKDYSYLLPEKGDFALVIDAAPFFEYAADLLNFSGGSPATSPAFQSFREDIMGKYFLSPNLALRMRLGINVNNFTRNDYVRDDGKFMLDPLSEDKVVDVWKHRQSAFDLGFGLEKRIGISRVQGYIGGEVFLGITTGSEEYQYGNPIAQSNVQPTASNPNGNVMGGVRILNEKQGNGFAYGLRGIIGADVFLTKNFAIGGEIALEMRGENGGKVLAATEEWDSVQVSVKENLASPGNSSFRMGFRPITSLNISIFF